MNQHDVATRTATIALAGRRIRLEYPIDCQASITTQLAGGKFYEEGLLKHLRHASPVGMVCIDVGANIGNHSVFFEAFMGGTVLAVEPHAPFVSVLRRNLERHVTSLGSFCVFPYAAGKVTGGVDERGNRQVTVDDVWTMAEHAGTIGTVGILKIDVDGPELDVLAGAARVLADFRPYVVVEALTAQAEEQTQAFMADFGYALDPTFSAPHPLCFCHLEGATP